VAFCVCTDRVKNTARQTAVAIGTWSDRTFARTVIAA